MAKKKKHHKKRSNHKQNVAKNTTSTPKVRVENTDKTDVPSKQSQETTVQPNKNNLEMNDVKYSLALFGIIVIIFAVLFVILQNQSVSNYFYGFIKISK